MTTDVVWHPVSETPSNNGAYWLNLWMRGVKIGYWLTDCHGDGDWCWTNGERIYGVTHYAVIEYPPAPEVE
jgi:hypothetical protein